MILYRLVSHVILVLTSLYIRKQPSGAFNSEVGECAEKGIAVEAAAPAAPLPLILATQPSASVA
jgi:hypothetical protein